MKTLFLIRHAKSSWEYDELPDFERPLNARGRRDAPMMGDRLKEQGVMPDVMVTSSANRALTTARILAERMGYPLNELVVTEDLYEADHERILEVVRSMPHEASAAVVVGHNPGLTMAAGLLTGEHFENVVTTGVVVIDFPVESWHLVAPGGGTLKVYDYPKKQG